VLITLHYETYIFAEKHYQLKLYHNGAFLSVDKGVDNLVDKANTP